MVKLKWEKQTINGGLEDNWNKVKSYLERTSPEFSKSVKFLEHKVNGKICTSVIYPLIVVGDIEENIKL